MSTLNIVKVIAVGNEAMVHWATQYYVAPSIILKWVNHLQDLKANDKLPAGVWITSSDNYESWGGGATEYRTADLESLIRAVDYVSLHTYPFHETHYDPEFWAVPESEEELSQKGRAAKAVQRAMSHAKAQFQGTADYIESLGIEKQIHIGETGWASISSGSYGIKGSRAADEYKLKLYYDLMREWTNNSQMSCFYFEAFDEKWKDSGDPDGSENHFGLFTLDGAAKYPLWYLVDSGAFKGLTRDGKPVTKTFGGDPVAMQASLLPVPLQSELGILKIKTVNSNRRLGNPVTESRYIIAHDTLDPDNNADGSDMSYPSAPIKLNIWEGSCNIQMSKDRIIEVTAGTNPDGWWGCGLEIQPDESTAAEGVIGENLTELQKWQTEFRDPGRVRKGFQSWIPVGKVRRWKSSQQLCYVWTGAQPTIDQRLEKSFHPGEGSRQRSRLCKHHRRTLPPRRKGRRRQVDSLAAHLLLQGMKSVRGGAEQRKSFARQVLRQIHQSSNRMYAR